jgi:hypothetical protein
LFADEYISRKLLQSAQERYKLVFGEIVSENQTVGADEVDKQQRTKDTSVEEDPVKNFNSKEDKVNKSTEQKSTKKSTQTTKTTKQQKTKTDIVNKDSQKKSTTTKTTPKKSTSKKEITKEKDKA